MSVGVISVDPSSPFTQGALLGDRIRLSDHFLDPGVFIRSMGTRGHLGGLAEATLQAALLLDAAGKELVLLETVGAGQSEVEIIGIADTVLLVLMPGSGDSVQALKAGIMEIPGRDRDQQDGPSRRQDDAERGALDPRRSTASASGSRRSSSPRRCGARTCPQLWEKLEEHRALPRVAAACSRSGGAGTSPARCSRSRRAGRRRTCRQRSPTKPELRRLLDEVQARELDPLSAVREILEKVYGIGDGSRARRSLSSRRPRGPRSPASRA